MTRKAVNLHPLPSTAKSLPANFFERGARQVARDLIGVVLTLDGVGGVITETEAYTRSDPASHSFNGRTPRNAAMFLPPGHAYVYRSYGIHWCLNFTCGARTGGRGHAVLIRALEPLYGIEAMTVRRGLSNPRLLCAGPGRLAQALGIEKKHDGAALTHSPFALSRLLVKPKLVRGPRIGISKAIETPWRFGLHGSVYLSRAFPSAD